MKNIQREANALDKAMAIASDIKDKPYSYVVARIQEAILGKDLPEELVGDGDWHAAMLGIHREDNRASLFLTNPRGESGSYILPVAAKTAWVTEFITAITDPREKIRGEWWVAILESGAVYLRSDVLEIPLGAISRGTVELRILSELHSYLEHCRRFPARERT